MSPQVFERTVACPASTEETFEWHVRPGALRRLLPPWDNARVKSGSGPEERLEKGARTTIRLGIGPVGIDWVAEIAELDAEARYFVDRSLSGPFKTWVHRHAVEAADGGTSTLTDHIDYELPMGPLGRLFGGGFTRSKLERMFAWRHRILLNDLRLHAEAREHGFTAKTIAITGASGLVGGSLAAFLRTGGHRVLELVRREPRAPHEVRWDPAAGTVDHARLEGIDGLVHLAGESIFGLRWTEEKKRRIVDSRVKGTRAIVNAIAAMLATMLPAFKAGVGGKLASGQQWFPWVALDDVIGGFHRALFDPSVKGPANLVAPGEVRNVEFTKTLGKVLGRPTILPVPKFGLQAAIGKEQAEEMLLASVRVAPAALEKAGFRFAYPRLEDALMHGLGKRK